MGKAPSTPAAKRAANERNIDLSLIKGTGAGGYVQLSDVLAYKISMKLDGTGTPAHATHVAKAAAAYLGIDINKVSAHGRVTKADVLAWNEMSADKKLPLTGMRKVIAANMSNSMQAAPQYTMMMEADCYELKRFMPVFVDECIIKTGVKPTYTDIFVKACAMALIKNPLINSSFMGDHILIKGNINIGIAVSLGDKGLIVPNIKNADRLSLSEIAVKRESLVTLALTGKLPKEDYSNGTFTMSNLGVSPVQYFTPIINQPESAILGVGSITDKAVPVNGGIGIRPIAGLSLTADHRNIDGTVGEQFMKDIKALLENPELLIRN